MYLYEFELRWPNPHRVEGYSTAGVHVGPPRFTEAGAGKAMERHLRSLTGKLRELGVYSAEETIRKVGFWDYFRGVS